MLKNISVRTFIVYFLLSLFFAKRSCRLSIYRRIVALNNAQCNKCDCSFFTLDLHDPISCDTDQYCEKKY